MTWLKDLSCGIKNGNAKLSDDDVWEIRRARAAVKGKRAPNGDPRTIYALAEKYGVKAACISKIARGERWTHHLGH